MLSDQTMKEHGDNKYRREDLTHYRSLFMWVSIPWSIVPAVVVSCATILDVAIALCNGKSDCAHAISPPNLFSYHTVNGIETSCPPSFMLYLTLNPKH
jgi:hypothetical protein